MNVKKLYFICLVAGFATGLVAASVYSSLINCKTVLSVGSTVFMMPNNRPGTVSVTVRDKTGSPISNLKVRVVDASGGSSADTGDDGQAVVSIKENVIEFIVVDDKPILKSNFLKRIDCRDGVQVFYYKDLK